MLRLLLRLSYFEPRLEYWRQLWRVLERCDIALLIVDCRHPLLHFSDALVYHVIKVNLNLNDVTRKLRHSHMPGTLQAASCLPLSLVGTSADMPDFSKVFQHS